MARAKALSYEELMELAKANYNKGGDSTYECWDERDFNEWVKEFGPMTKKKALAMFKQDAEIRGEYEAAAKFFSGEDGTDWSEYEAEATAKALEEAGAPEIAQEIRNEMAQTTNKEDKEMKQNEKTNGQAQIMQIEVDGVKFTQTRPNYYYKNVDGKQTRISKAEWEQAFDKYTQIAADNAEQDAEIEEAKKPVEKKTRKSKDIALELDVTYANEDHHITLTAKQVAFIKRMPEDDFYEHGLESALWIDVFCDTVADEFNPMAVGAMVSTLREKNILSVSKERVNGKTSKYMAFTAIGMEVAKALGLN